MSRVDGVLVVSLTHKWFDMIARGEKLEEYRGAHWAGRLLTECGKMLRRNDVGFGELSVVHGDFERYTVFRAQRAYSGVWLERKIKCVRWGKPRPEWSGETVTGDCFIIELDPCT